MGKDAQKVGYESARADARIPAAAAAARADELLAEHGRSALQMVVDAIQAAVRRSDDREALEHDAVLRALERKAGLN
jgi:hypothetical protein